MITEAIKSLLGGDLAAQVEDALKGKGKEGKDIDLVVGNDGSFVPAEKYNAANAGKASAEAALKSAAEVLKGVGGSGDPAKIAEDVKAAESKMDEAGKTHKAELLKIQKVAALKTALTGKVHDPDDIINLLDLSRVEITESGSLKSDIDELIKPYAESKAHYFINKQQTDPQQPPVINGAQPASAGAQPTKKNISEMTYTEMLAYEASNPGVEL